MRIQAGKARQWLENESPTLDEVRATHAKLKERFDTGGEAFIASEPDLERTLSVLEAAIVDMEEDVELHSHLAYFDSPADVQPAAEPDNPSDTYVFDASPLVPDVEDDAPKLNESERRARFDSLRQLYGAHPSEASKGAG